MAAADNTRLNGLRRVWGYATLGACDEPSLNYPLDFARTHPRRSERPGAAIAAEVIMAGWAS